MDTLIWLVLMVVFLIVEAACPVHLVSVWFAAGSLVAMAVSWLGGPVWLQVTLFLAVSGALLAALWPIVRKYLRPKIVKTNVDAVVGTQGYVIADISNPDAKGQVKLGGMEWSARSSDGLPITAGTLIRVDRVEGAKVFVTPVSQEQTVCI